MGVYFQAGISSEKLIIALEPEAASLFCRHLPMDKRLDKSGVSISSFSAGTKYMVLDAGGKCFVLQIITDLLERN